MRRIGGELEQSAINSIDPPLTFFRVIGIPTESDGTSGVLVAEVSASYSGPHRAADLNCYVRRGTNSVPIPMREINDIVMRLSRRQDEIQRRLAERRELFERWIGCWDVGVASRLGVMNLRVGFRVTAIPVGAPLYLDRVFRNPAVSRDLVEINGTWKVKQDVRHLFSSPKTGLGENPVLGGTRWSTSGSDRAAEKTILRDGLIDIWFRWPWYKDQRGSSEKAILHFDWVVASSANALASIDAFRNAVQAPTCEYGLQLELVSTNGSSHTSLRLVDTRYGSFESFGDELATPAILGPYSIGDGDKAMNLIVRDLYDASAIPQDAPQLEIDWPASSLCFGSCKFGELAHSPKQTPELRSLSGPSRFSLAATAKIAPNHLPRTTGEDL